MAVTQQQLRQVMKFHLRNFSGGQSVTNQTVHSEILSGDDGTGTASSKRLYKGFIRWTLQQNGAGNPSWPAKWIDLTVSELVAKLLPDG